MDTNNILIILATSLVIIGILLLYRHINTVNNRLNTIETFLNKQSLVQNIPIKKNAVVSELPEDVAISENNECVNSEVERELNSLNSSQKSIERAQIEVEDLNNQIDNLDRLIDEESQNNVNINNFSEQNRIESILNKTAENDIQYSSNYTNDQSDISNREKVSNITSEYEELANYNNENNSELNALIQVEKNTDDGVIPEQISSSGEHVNNTSLQELEEHESNENIELNKIGDEIEIDVIVSKYSLKVLKDLCKKNSLRQTGSKKDLVVRLIKFDSSILNNMSNNTINISDN